MVVMVPISTFLYFIFVLFVKIHKNHLLEQAMESNKVEWDLEALERLKKAPFFIRGIAKRKVDRVIIVIFKFLMDDRAGTAKLKLGSISKTFNRHFG